MIVFFIVFFFNIPINMYSKDPKTNQMWDE